MADEVDSSFSLYREYTIDSSFSSFLLGQEAVQTVNQEVDTDSLSSFSFPNLFSWENQYEEETVQLTKQVISIIREHFISCFEVVSLLDLIKTAIAYRYKAYLNDLRNIRDYDELLILAKKNAQINKDLSFILQKHNRELLETMEFQRAFTITSLVEDLPYEYDTNTKKEMTRKRVQRLCSRLQRLGVLNAFVLQKPYLERSRRTSIWFVCFASDEDLGRIIAQMINCDRGRGFVKTKVEEDIEAEWEKAKAEDEIREFKAQSMQKYFDVLKKKEEEKDLKQVIETKVKSKVLNTIAKNEAKIYTKVIEKEYTKNNKTQWTCKKCNVTFEADLNATTDTIKCPKCKKTINLRKTAEIIKPVKLDLDILPVTEIQEALPSTKLFKTIFVCLNCGAEFEEEIEECPHCFSNAIERRVKS